MLLCLLLLLLRVGMAQGACPSSCNGHGTCDSNNKCVSVVHLTSKALRG